MPEPNQQQPVTTAPSESFVAHASAGLANVAEDLDTVRESAGSGNLRMDEDYARHLLAALADVESRVQRMILRSSDLDVRLRLGDNVVGQAMSERLRGAASGGAGAAIPVLEDFAEMVQGLEATVRKAAGLYRATEDEAQQRILDVMRSELDAEGTV